MDKYIYDIFISYASENSLIAEDIAKRLTAKGLKIWLDKIVLKIGDSIRENVDLGLGNARFVVVILSKDYLRKPWPKREFNGLVTIEMAEGRTIMLPIWHKISSDEIRSFSSPLADKVALRTTDGNDHIVEKIVELFGPPTTQFKKLEVLAAERGFSYKKIFLKAQVLDHNSSWIINWNADIVAEKENLEGVGISYRIDDLLENSLVDSVMESDIEIEERTAAHPRSIAKYFKFINPLVKGNIHRISYKRSFRKVSPAKKSDLFVTKVALQCDLLIVCVSFDKAPKRLVYKITDRNESVVFHEKLIELDINTLEIQKTIKNPDTSLTYGFFWEY